MAIKQQKPLTPGQRFASKNKQDLTKARPERRLLSNNPRKKGRNCYGRITSRRRGGGHKRLYRNIDFKRDKVDIPAKVVTIEYDPNRSANLALLSYLDGDKRYILAPKGLNIGDVVYRRSGPVDDYTPGLNVPLKFMPPSMELHAIEMQPGKGAQIARGAGVSARLVNVEGDRATLKMPSGEIRIINASCRATVGVVGNSEHRNIKLGKAGRNRWLGRRPRVRGVAMNPHDHPMGGGEGRTSGGGHPVSPWGKLAKGYKTRTRSKPSNAQILVRRDGRRMKKG